MLEDSSYSSSEPTSFSASTMSTRYRDRYNNLAFGGVLGRMQTGWAMPGSEYYSGIGIDGANIYRDGQSLRRQTLPGYTIPDEDSTDSRDFYRPAKRGAKLDPYDRYQYAWK